MQRDADESSGSSGTATLRPTVEDRDAGLVGIAGGFDLKHYPIMAVARFSVTDAEVNGEDGQRLAAMMPEVFQSELVGRLRETRLFARVIDLGEGRVSSGPDRALRSSSRPSR